MEMNEKLNLLGACANAVSEAEKDNIRLGMDIAKVKSSYYYEDLMTFLKGDDEHNGSMYFVNLKPLFDKYGYEKVLRYLLELDKEEKPNE
jgi:hypothetical protein